MLVSEFHYDLPPELIAQHPPATRGASRMLTVERRTGTFADHLFADLPDLLAPGDLLVLNDSRVLPARLYATRAGLRTQHNSPDPAGLVEVLLTEHLPSPEGHNDWRALVRPAKKIQPGETLQFHDPAAAPEQPPALTATVLSAGDFGERTLRFTPTHDFIATVERIGHMPLPPYIHRDKHRPDTPEDRERYQTIYSQQSGSAAAPTAGLHFTPEILAALAARGIELAYITLHVGLGTFQPVRVADTREIRLHSESYTLNAGTAQALNSAHRENRRIVAVGTTTTRTLEHLARRFEANRGPLSPSNPLALDPHSGSTGLFLSPAPDGDADFKLVRGLLTNFHLPESTLLMLVCAFAGREVVLHAYAHAVASRYRFFSYGDCMLLT
ncbi:MAG TPA: tRNA preQ1(34) S-adenosylmethionine ribosyltransferase-isomerase QueA [Acidobacteriaceae bacterium]|jgi:S-adenosylmethionine:tRNA ribosyltransferase-isomerase